MVEQVPSTSEFWRAHLHLISPLGGGFPSNIAVTFGTEKLEWCGYSTVCLFVSTEYINVTDTQTDGQTHGRTDTA